MPNFTFAEYDLVNIAKAGAGRIDVKVDGYWSASTISIYIDFFRYGRDGLEVYVNHSTGGRDTDEVADDNTATLNFADALRASAQLAIDIKSRAYLVDICKAARDAKIAEYKAEEDAKKALVESDTQIGKQEAQRIINELKESIKADDNVYTAALTLRARGKNSTFTIRAEKKRNNSVRVYGPYGDTINAAGAVREIAGAAELVTTTYI